MAVVFTLLLILVRGKICGNHLEPLKITIGSSPKIAPDILPMAGIVHLLMREAQVFQALDCCMILWRGLCVEFKRIRMG